MKRFVTTVFRFGPLSLLLLALSACAAGGSSAALSVSLKKPEVEVYTNGQLAIEVSISGGAPESVDLLIGKTVLTNLTTPYTFNWDTSKVPEADYQLIARASLGGKTFESSPRTIHVDRTAPLVLSYSPSSGDSQVAANAPVSLSFSEPLKASTVSESSVSLIGNANKAYPKSVVLSADGKSLSLRYQQELLDALPQTLNVSFSGMTDLAGNALSADPWNWTLPDWLQLGLALDKDKANYAFFPAIASDTSGNPVVAWREIVNNDTGESDVYVKQWDGNDWQQLGAALEPNASDSALYPDIALSKANKIFVAFQDYPEASPSQLYVRSWNGSSWETLGEALNIDTLVDAERPSIVVGDDGNPIVAWTEYDAPHSSTNVYVKQWSGTAWTQLGNPVDDSILLSVDTPMLAVRGSTLMVAYAEQDVSSKNIYVAEFKAGDWAKVGDYLDINLTSDAINPSLALDESGKPYVAWQEDAGAEFNNVYVKEWNGSTWEKLGDDPEKAQDSEEPSLTVDSGNLNLGARVCKQSVSKCDIHVYQFDNASKTWLRQGGSLDTAPSLETEDPHLALDASNPKQALVTWSEYDGKSFNIYVKRFNYAEVAQ